MSRAKVNLTCAAIIALIAVLAACGTSPWKQDKANAHLNIGIAYLGSERFNDALKELLEAEKFAPDDPQIHYYMGIAYYGKALPEKAADEFKKAISLKSDYSEAHNFLGRLYMEKSLWDDAIAAFKEALANILYETPDKALFNMARAYHGKGDYQKALSTYEEAKNKQPHTIPPPLIDHYIGITFFAKGDMEKAIQYFTTSLKQAPALVESRYWLGQCYMKLNDMEKAKAEFRAILKITPESELGIAAKRSLDMIEASRYRP
ncbi:MAG: tetratricopeptide repeat protein [Deltaproteobacteria bacterium]|nr:tetratricopeptide repeat protein [Deltaproteobacteria bacterium]